MVEDAPEQEVAEARSTDEYKDAYESTSAQLGEAPKDQAVEACKAVWKRSSWGTGIDDDV